MGKDSTAIGDQHPCLEQSSLLGKIFTDRVVSFLTVRLRQVCAASGKRMTEAPSPPPTHRRTIQVTGSTMERQQFEGANVQPKVGRSFKTSDGLLNWASGMCPEKILLDPSAVRIVQSMDLNNPSSQFLSITV